MSEAEQIVEGLADAAHRLAGEVEAAHGVIDRQGRRMADLATRARAASPEQVARARWASWSHLRIRTGDTW